LKKRIILLLDGTWNDSDFGPSDTNIVRIREAIAQTLNARTSRPAIRSDPASHDGDSGPEKVTPTTTNELQNIVFYERGVGTGAFLDRFFGGAFGQGLSDNIRRAYKFLSFHYEDGDEVFVFGFSRGAYTARSLVGYIHAAGLLRRDQCTEDLEQVAWDFYRCPPNDRLPGTWTYLLPHMNDRAKLRISLLGVFDTVGALGIPASAFRIANRDKYEFHDVELSSIVDVNLHAVAINENREAFEATVWRQSKFKNFDTKTEQVWFTGAHSDVGGGYINQELRSTKFPNSLDDITLDWMIRRVKSHYNDFPINEDAWGFLTEQELMDRSTADLHNSRVGFYRFTPKAFRSISNEPVALRRRWLFRFLNAINVTRDRHATAINEAVHISALFRAFKASRKSYSPENLISVIGAIRTTYSGGRHFVGVVGWDGKLLDANLEMECKRALDLIS
jgi:Uncharacterized alpha/beta hydrolase domain (DUF2235)